MDNYGATLRVDQALGSFDLTSITHYRYTWRDSNFDLDGSGAFDILTARQLSKQYQYGQELRLASDATQPLSGIFGLYFEKDKSKERVSYYTAFNGLGLDINNYVEPITKTTALAAFASLTFKVTDTLSVIGGVRKSYEKKTLDNRGLYFLNGPTGTYDWSQGDVFINGAPPVTPDQTLVYRQKQKATPWTWDATINYNPDRNFLLFARVARGYRSGGFNAAPFDFDNSKTLASKAPFNPEFVTSYEAGIKTTLLDGRARLNASVYHYDYTDQQLTVYLGGISQFVNAGKSEVDGGEIELNISPTDALDIRGSVAYTDATFKDYIDPFLGIDFSGNRLIQAPKWTANTGVTYTASLSPTFDLKANTTWAYRSSINFDAGNDPNLRGKKLLTGNIRLGVEPVSGKGFSVAAFVNNLTNKRPLASGYNLDTGFYGIGFDIGRSFGLDATYKW